MRIQIITLLCLLTFNVFASNDKEMKSLFEKYDQVMNEHKVELVYEVFTEKFLKENGGKEEFIEKVKELPKVKKKKNLKSMLQSWKKTKVGKIFFAKVKDESDPKKAHPSESQFVVIEENGKLKIDGTISDGE